LTDNRINYVYMDYNGGAPVIGVTTDRATLDGRTEFILGKVYREGTTLHILSYGIRLTELAYNEHERLTSVRGFERASGGEISETGQRYLTSGAGVFYFGLNRITTSAQDTSGADRFTYWYRDGGGGWTKVTGQQQIDNTHYDDGSGALATLTANRYGVHWVYIHFDSDINVIYGQGNYKLAEAENAVLPDTVPELVSDFGVLAAKIVVQKSGANLLTVKSAYKELFPTTFPPKLGDLTDVNAETPNDNDVLSWDAGTSRWIAVTGGVSGFIGLSDTPANYAGSAGYFLRVNATPDAVEFRSPAQVLSDLSGQAGAAFSWNSQDLTSVGDIQVGNGKYVGVSGDARIAYDSTNHYLKVLGGDFFTDRWLLQTSNTFLGVGVAGAGNLAHTTGIEGYSNTIIGCEAGYSITTGYKNFILGCGAGYSITSGYDNVLLGEGSGYNLATSYGNVLIGNKAGYSLDARYNVMIGRESGYETTSGQQNTFLGGYSGHEITSGDQCVCVGMSAGRFQSDGSTGLQTPENSVYIGAYSKSGSDPAGGEDAIENEIVIGHNAIGEGANTIRLGDTNITLLKTQGKINAVGGFSDNGNDGVDGTFVDNNGNTITVSGGIITSLS